MRKMIENDDDDDNSAEAEEEAMVEVDITGVNNTQDTEANTDEAEDWFDPQPEVEEDERSRAGGAATNAADKDICNGRCEKVDAYKTEPLAIRAQHDRKEVCRWSNQR